MSSRNGSGSTYLANSVENEQSIDRLFQRDDFDLFSTDSKGMTVLHHASINGDPEVMGHVLKKVNQRKIKKKIKVRRRPFTLLDFPDDTGKTPLHLAVMFAGSKSRDFAQTVKVLLENKADFRKKDKQKNTPLYLAVTNNNEEITKLLLEHGANPDHLSRNNTTPLMQATLRNYISICRILLDYNVRINSNFDEEMKRTCFKAAWDHDHMTICQLLYLAGADLNKEPWLPKELGKREGRRLKKTVLLNDFIRAKSLDIEHCCRKVIREQLPKNQSITKNLEKFNYPTKLKDLLLLNDGLICEEEFVCTRMESHDWRGKLY